MKIQYNYQRLLQQAEKFRRQHLTEADSQQLCEQGYIYFENEKAIGACMEIKPRRFEPHTFFVNLKGDVYLTIGVMPIKVQKMLFVSIV